MEKEKAIVVKAASHQPEDNKREKGFDGHASVADIMSAFEHSSDEGGVGGGGVAKFWGKQHKANDESSALNKIGAANLNVRGKETVGVRNEIMMTPRKSLLSGRTGS